MPYRMTMQKYNFFRSYGLTEHKTNKYALIMQNTNTKKAVTTKVL